MTVRPPTTANRRIERERIAKLIEKRREMVRKLG